MKKTILFCMLLFTGLAAGAQTTNLVGKWFIIDGGDSLYFEFTKDSLIILSGKGVEGATESYTDIDTMGGRNFPYETDEGDTVFVDFTFKSFATKPTHLFYVLYYAGTQKPYLIMPILVEPVNGNTITLYFLSAKSDHSDEDGILYKNAADWQLADDTITAALNDDKTVAYDEYTLTRLTK